MWIARSSSATNFRVQRNVGSCALDSHVDLGRVFVVDLAQTSIQFLLQSMQLETELHLSTVGAHSSEVLVKFSVNLLSQIRGSVTCKC